MLLRHNTLSVVLLIFVTTTHHAAGVQIDSVGLKNGLPYVRRLSLAHVEFNLTMEPEETLQSVVWQMEDRNGRYEWQANGTVIVSGIFLGAINITAPNGELVFPQVQLDNAGHYNLTVFTSNGNDTATYKLTVYEYSGFSFSFPWATWENCTWPVKMMVYPVAPYPNISCVFEDGIGGAPSVSLDTITEVKPNVTENEDGTFNYEVAPNIPMLLVPMDSWMSWQLWVEEISIPILSIKISRK